MSHKARERHCGGMPRADVRGFLGCSSLAAVPPPLLLVRSLPKTSISGRVRSPDNGASSPPHAEVPQPLGFGTPLRSVSLRVVSHPFSFRLAPGRNRDRSLLSDATPRGLGRCGRSDVHLGDYQKPVTRGSLITWYWAGADAVRQRSSKEKSGARSAAGRRSRRLAGPQRNACHRAKGRRC